MLNNWQDGFTYEMYERQQAMLNRYEPETYESELKEFWVNWQTDEYEGSELVRAYDAEDAEEVAENLIPQGAEIASVELKKEWWF